MKKTENSGFTLIELLVVIAIIGILAAVVLTSLSSARDSAQDASAQASMSSIRAAAEIYYNENGSYDSVCDDEDVEKLRAAVADKTPGTAVCNSTGNTWYVYARLNRQTENNERYCVDSSGFSGVVSSSPTGDLCQ